MLNCRPLEIILSFTKMSEKIYLYLISTKLRMGLWQISTSQQLERQILMHCATAMHVFPVMFVNTFNYIELLKLGISWLIEIYMLHKLSKWRSWTGPLEKKWQSDSNSSKSRTNDMAGWSRLVLCKPSLDKESTWAHP